MSALGANRTRRDSGNDANDPVQTCATRNLAAQMSISNPPFRQSDPETNIDGACDGKCALSAGRNRQHNTRSSPRGNPTLPRLLQPVSVSRDTFSASRSVRSGTFQI